MEAAHRTGAVVSYDLNYRDSLWKAHGGKARALEVNSELAPLVDGMLGNEEDFTASLGFEVEGLANVDEHVAELDTSNFKRMIERAVAKSPNFRVVATTLRNARKNELRYWNPQTKQWIEEPSDFDVWAGEDSTASLHADLKVTQ